MSQPAQMPYESLPDVVEFTLTSTEMSADQSLALAQVSGIFGAGGQDISPQLAWSNAPAGTKSFVVTCFDPDAPTGSGFWHWAVYNIGVSVTSLPTNAGSQDGAALPDGASQLRNDAGLAGYLGAAPPQGHGPHRYVFAVHALSVETLPITDDVTPAICGFNMFGNTLGRAMLVPVYEQ